MLYIYNYSFKYVYFLFIYSYLFFIDYIFIHNDNKEIINIDNEFTVNLHESDLKFGKYKTNLKPIAFYYPEYNNISYYKYFNNSFKQNIISNNSIYKLVKKQVKLAKNHLIYGFAIYYDLFNITNISCISIEAFLNKVNFPFFMVWRNEEIDIIDNNTLDILINKIERFMISENYIKFKQRPILSLNNKKNFENGTRIISFLRYKAKKRIGKIFILYPFKGKLKEKIFIRKNTAIYDFSKIDLFEEVTNRPNTIYYTGFIYKNLILNNLNVNYILFRTTYLNNLIFKDYKPAKFYMLNRLIAQSVYNNYCENEGIMFIDSWNNYLSGNYLEFDEKFGYSSINSFTKSLLDLPYQEKNNFISNNKKTIIAIQVHVFYEDLFEKILERINLIPFKYDLYISTTSEEKKIKIEKYLINSNHNYYEIRIFENKGRDVYPFINQMRIFYKYYKYICHLHTKKSLHKKLLGLNWSEYIYQNLIGSRKIISNIICDFEENDKLGFIFPENYYEIIKGIKDFDNSNLALHAINKKFMNYILESIFHRYKIGDKLIFPVGNMFWAKTKAIYQIFNIKLKFPEELSQINTTIMHAIERIWLYLVKLNGYLYKQIIYNY